MHIFIVKFIDRVNEEILDESMVFPCASRHCVCLSSTRLPIAHEQVSDCIICKLVFDPLLYVFSQRVFIVNVVKPVTFSPRAYSCCDDVVRGRSVIAFLSIGAQLVVVCWPYTQVNVEFTTQLIGFAVWQLCEVGNFFPSLARELGDDRLDDRLNLKGLVVIKGLPYTFQCLLQTPPR
jgi:hypothetical protein